MNLAAARSLLKDRLQAVEERIRAACRRANRAREEVTLVAVTKYVGCEIAALLPEFGVLDLGESRPQELWRKAAALPKDVRWHLVGHLQRNKIEKTLPLVHLIHSVDSVRLLKALYEEAEKQDRHVDVLLEFNLSREPAKHGFAPEDVRLIAIDLEWIRSRLHIRGLMTMAAHFDDPEKCRPTFHDLREIRDVMQSVWCMPGERLPELSMGMTDDFEIAIEEGATLIRIGSALFDGLTELQS